MATRKLTTARGFDPLRAVAADYGITVEPAIDAVKFRAPDGHIIAWMYRVPGGWQGFTESPEVTGTKVGSKEAVANWCLDWAANGF